MRARVISPIALLLALLLILGVDALALFKDWYPALPWLDNVLHLSGGAWVALLLRYALRTPALAALQGAERSWAAITLLTIACVALVGVGWEFFEFTLDTFWTKPYGLPPAQLGVADTMSDLFFDLVGGAFVAVLLR